MISRLLHSYQLLEENRASLLKEMQSLPAEILTASDGNRWSILQITAHLITAERLSVMYMQKKILGIEKAGDTGLWEELKLGLLIISQRLPLKFKAPQAVVQQTTQATSLQQLEQEWDQVRSEMKALLDRIQPHQSKRKIYKHVVAGKLNASQALRFFHEHILHHLPQVQRLKKQHT
jgi:hypothetical protein